MSLISVQNKFYPWVQMTGGWMSRYNYG